MIIADIQSIPVGDFHFVRVTTEDGKVGLGSSSCWAYPQAVDEVIDIFRPTLIGQDPRRVEHLWSLLYRIGPFRGSVLSAAVSAVDIAFWDLRGQYYNAPIWELLGGPTRDRIRLCALLSEPLPEERLRSAEAAVAEGFTAVKFSVLPDGYENFSYSKLASAIRDIVYTMRETVGWEIDLVLEFGRRLPFLQALPILDDMRQARPLLCEDPIQIDSIDDQAELARRLILPMAYGERLHNIWEFRELLGRGGPQFVRPDVGLAGGITHCKRIAAVAEAFNAPVFTHNYFGPVLTACAMHLDASIPNFVVQEYTTRDESAVYRAFRSAFVREGGYMLLPEVPGLGVELDVDELSADDLGHYMGDFVHKTPRRADGSVALAV